MCNVQKYIEDIPLVEFMYLRFTRLRCQVFVVVLVVRIIYCQDLIYYFINAASNLNVVVD